jgi:hypothetical protein
VEVLERLQIPYLVTGAIASIAYGEPRLTNGIDIVADIKRHHIQGLVEAFPSCDFNVSEEAVRAAVRHRGQFNILHPSSGLKVDVILTPTAPTPAFRIGEKVEDPLQMYLSDIFTIPVNLAGIPALVLPCGFSREGLRSDFRSWGDISTRASF